MCIRDSPLAYFPHTITIGRNAGWRSYPQVRAHHANTLYRDERAPKFCSQRAVPGQICSQRLYASLSMLLAIATVLVRDALFGDKGRGVIAPKLSPLIAYKHLLDALSGWIFDLNVSVETKTAFDVTTHLVVRITCKGSLQIFLQHRDNFLARQLNR